MRCLGDTGFTNPPIGQTLPADGGQQHVVAFGISDLERRAAVVTEIELGKVAMQVSLAAMLVDAQHPALED